MVIACRPYEPLPNVERRSCFELLDTGRLSLRRPSRQEPGRQRSPSRRTVGLHTSDRNKFGHPDSCINSRNGRMTLDISLPQGPCGNIIPIASCWPLGADARLSSRWHAGEGEALCAIQARQIESAALCHLHLRHGPWPCQASIGQSTGDVEVLYNVGYSWLTRASVRWQTG